MKKVVVEVIKLIVLSIILNIVTNFINYFIQFESSELVAYIIYLVKHMIIIYMGVKIFGEDLELETVKKIVLTFMIVTITYNVFFVAKSMADYEQSLSMQFSDRTIQYDETLTKRERKELEEVTETIAKAGQNIQKYLEEEKDEYYEQLIRIYVIIYSIIVIVLYCFVAPKWFVVQKSKKYACNP